MRAGSGARGCRPFPDPILRCQAPPTTDAGIAVPGAPQRKARGGLAAPGLENEGVRTYQFETIS